ncbi:MAG: hypothetical protein FJZ86_11565 [Chloroflexi bacterium]|nr:hypothetical protein [Chloroflexota bacterium]
MRLRGGIAGYFQYVSGILALSRIVKSQDVHTEKRTSTEGFLRGDVFFKDGSRLHFRELVTTDPRVQRVSYTYHYMRADETLIFRYDDSDHFPKLPSAPDHKHVGENDVVAANAPDLQSVLKEIESLIDSKR